MILHFKEQIGRIMSDKDAHCNWITELGLGVMNEIQQFEEHTFMEITDEVKAAKYINHVDTETLSEIEADALIDTLFEPDYVIENDSLMLVNLIAKKDAGAINFDSMVATLSKKAELKALYEMGISGIRKTEKRKTYARVKADNLANNLSNK